MRPGGAAGDGAAEQAFEAGDEILIANGTARGLGAAQGGKGRLVVAPLAQQFGKPACAEPVHHRLHDDQGVVDARETGARTRPSPISRLRRQPRAHGIEAHSADGRDQVRLVHRDGGEAALKQVPGPAPARIDEVGVAPMCLADGAAETVFIVGDHDEVDVVGVIRGQYTYSTRCIIGGYSRFG